MFYAEKQYRELLEKRRPQINQEVKEWISGALNPLIKPYKKQRERLRPIFREYFLGMTAKDWPDDQVQIAVEEFDTVFDKEVGKWG